MCYDVEQLQQRIEKRARHDNYQIRIKFPKPDGPENYYHVNGFDHPYLMVITSEEPNYLQPLKWGLMPSWAKTEAEAKELSNATLNAKKETIFEKRSFRDNILKRRCLIPVDGFFESLDLNKQKYPHFIYRTDKEPFYLGGIYDRWVNPITKRVVETFSIITTPANELLERIHNVKKRMPFILPYDIAMKWVDNTLNKVEVGSMIQVYPDLELTAYPVSKKIHRDADTNMPEIIEPFEYPELGMLG